MFEEFNKKRSKGATLMNAYTGEIVTLMDGYEEKYMVIPIGKVNYAIPNRSNIVNHYIKEIKGDKRLRVHENAIIKVEYIKEELDAEFYILYIAISLLILEKVQA